MNVIKLILSSLACAYNPDLNCNLFGSRKRRKEKAALAGEFKEAAGETQAEIDQLKTVNPFESASAKSAMTRSARTAQQMRERMFNTMGAGVTPEALIASQGAASEAEAQAAGQIASGAEAAKAAEIARLRGLKSGQMGAYGGMMQSSIDERGSGWKDALSAMETLAKVSEGVGKAGGSLGGGGGGGDMASAEAAAAALSDKRAKENIKCIGELQGQRIYKYNYIGCNETHIGVIAQEVDSKYVDNSGDFKKVYYDQLFESVNEQ